MEVEIWKPIPGYEGFYELSNMGYIRSIGFIRNLNGKYYKRRSPRILKNGKDKDGYVICALCKNGKTKTFRVHRLIAEVFVENPNSYPQINHKNEIKDDNRASNLEWCTAAYNNNYGSKPSLLSKSLRNNIKKSKPIIQLTLDGEFVAEYPSAKEAKRRTGIFNITLACNHSNGYSTAGGYLWRWK